METLDTNQGSRQLSIVSLILQFLVIRVLLLFIYFFISVIFFFQTALKCFSLSRVSIENLSTFRVGISSVYRLPFPNLTYKITLVRYCYLSVWTIDLFFFSLFTMKACPVCLTGTKDMAFGCGHMVSSFPLLFNLLDDFHSSPPSISRICHSTNSYYLIKSCFVLIPFFVNKQNNFPK